MAAVVIAAAIAAPWLVWLPVGPLATVVLGAIALLAACHGWGRLVSRAVRAQTDPALAMVWGVAVVIALGGLMIALHVYDARLIVIAGAVAHSADLAIRFAPARDRVAPLLAWPRARWWLVPAAIAAVLGFMHVAGSAGHVTGRAFDDDGDVIAQVQRVTDTGALADPIGYPRFSQLGGHVALSALAAAFAEPRAARLVDAGIGFVLLLVLVLARIRPRDDATAVWASLVVLAAGAAALGGPDLAPLWTPAALLVALALGLDGPALPAALLAGASCTLRADFAPAAVALLVVAWWRGRRPWREDLPRIAMLVGGAAAVALPYAIARAMAWRGVDHLAMKLLEAHRASIWLRLGLAGVIAAAAAPLAVLAVRELEDRRLRPLAIAGALGVGAAVSGLAGDWHDLWPPAIAFAAMIAIAIAEHAPPARTGFVLAFLTCLVINDAQSQPLLSRWTWYVLERMNDAAYASRAAPEAGGYEDVLANVPPDDTVAVWVTRPELLDYGHHRILDLRSPRAARLRDSDRFGDLVAATRARWLLVEDDNAYAARASSSFLYSWMCPHPSPDCSDALERFVLAHPAARSRAGLRLLSLH